MFEIVSLIGKIIVFLINLIGIFLGWWVFSSGKDKKANRLFLVITLILVVWINLAFLANVVGDINLSLLLVRLDFGIIFLFFIPMFYFSLYFPDDNLIIKNILFRKILSFTIILSSFLNFCLAIFTSLVVRNVVKEEWGLNIILGEGNNLFYFLSFFLGVSIISISLKKYFSLSEKNKLKIFYYLMGILIFLLGNIAFNIFLPRIGYFQFALFGHYFILFFLGFTAYAIVKHKLFDIKVVLTSIFVFLIAILLLLDIIFLTPELLPQLYKGLLLVIFIYFGYLLIKSVTEEIKRREEMEILSRKLKKANLKLEKLVEMREEFLHITSHQLRTPLTAIRGMISMWHDGDFKNLPQEKKDEIKSRIYTSAERLNNITNDMINAMELEGKHFDFKFKPVSLEKIISGAVNTLKINYDAKGLFLNFKKPKKAFPKIQADPEYLSQIFINIINNAEKYTENGGTTISISQKAKNLIVEITDTGIGISKEGQKLLFRKFSRGQKAKEINTTGSGLGLYIAKQIVESHHGEIKVKSAGKNKGTTFIVVLLIKQPKE